MLRVIFVCVHNSGRSQIAKAFFNVFFGNRGAADSAGTRPAAYVNPTIVQAMRESGIDISHEKPKLLTLKLLERFDRVITMGCNLESACPASFLPTEDWALDDPSDKPIEEVRRIRDEIKVRVEKLAAEMQ